MNVQRTVGGWILRMGDKARKFRRLADIWDLISQDLSAGIIYSLLIEQRSTKHFRDSIQAFRSA